MSARTAADIKHDVVGLRIEKIKDLLYTLTPARIPVRRVALRAPIESFYVFFRLHFPKHILSSSLSDYF